MDLGKAHSRSVNSTSSFLVILLHILSFLQVNLCVSQFFSRAIPWTMARQAPLSMIFSRQEYWTRLPFPSPGDLPNTGIKLGSPALQADSLLSELPTQDLKINQTQNFLSNCGTLLGTGEFIESRVWLNFLGPYFLRDYLLTEISTVPLAGPLHPPTPFPLHPGLQ